MEIFQSVKVQLGLAPVEERGLFDDFNDSVSLTPTQRIWGFLMTCAMGATCLAIAMALVPTIVLFPKKFAFFVTMGNFFLFLAAGVLIGFRRQMQSMTESHRWQAAVMYLASMVLTMVAAIQWQSYILSVAFTGVQVAAFLWYVLSYIPFARRFVSVCWGMIFRVVGPVVSVLTRGCLKGCSMCCGSSVRQAMRI